MEELFGHIEALESSANLSKSIKDVEKAIQALEGLREAIAKNPKTAHIALAKGQAPFKSALEKSSKDLLPMYKTLGRYGKAVDKKIKDKPLPPEGISSHPELLDRAIAYHLLRDGHFDVFHTFVHESEHLADLRDSATPVQQQFEKLHSILHDMQERKSLDSAIQWACDHEEQLEARGSDLYFELCRQKFIVIFKSGPLPGAENPATDDAVPHNIRAAYEYAKHALIAFLPRYAPEIKQCLAALSFYSNISASPYSSLFSNASAFEDLARFFTREYCALLNLPADSALLTAANAGAIALPTILKVQSIMAHKNAAWSTEHELPVEIPLPSEYHFHSIFVCAVSKEQSTDDNPPMMLGCGHLISKESLDRMAKGTKVKCHYCPHIGSLKDAMQVVL